MSRYIDADELLMAFGEVRDDYNCFNELDRTLYEMWSNIIEFINAVARSSIDIVRCKDCKHCKRKKGTFRGEPIFFYRCEEHSRDVESDDFCSYGEREGE